jgi:hypothetical protein
MKGVVERRQIFIIKEDIPFTNEWVLCYLLDPYGRTYRSYS